MITKNYIEMCERAEEMQVKWKPKIGDTIKHRLTKSTQLITLYDIETYSDDFYIEEKYTWLPTQEQLFDMLLKWCQTDKILHHLLVGESINLYILKELYYYANSFDGMIFVSDIKALILSYIYKRKYNKIWNLKDWK